MSTTKFSLCALAAGFVVLIFAHWLKLDYFYFAGYTILQFIVLATAWNILGGYCGYVNFGTAAFFAIGAYSSVFLHKIYPLPLPLLMLVSAVVSGLIGLGTGYLTLRLRGAFFSIATLAMAVVLQTLVVNWDFVGGSRGAYIIRPETIEMAGVTINYIEYLFILMLILTVIALATAQTIERSQLGFGFATIRDDELAAEACGVPTLRLKLIATTMSGAFMGMAGAPFPYYIGYLQPQSAFGLEYAVNSIAMPMIGGTTTWVGPLIGAILLGSLQQIATVTISSAVNLLLVGVLLGLAIAFWLGGKLPLGSSQGAEGRRRRDVHCQNQRQFPLLPVAPHKWTSHSVGDIPIDVPHFIPRHVLPQFFEVHPPAFKMAQVGPDHHIIHETIGADLNSADRFQQFVDRHRAITARAQR